MRSTMAMSLSIVTEESSNDPLYPDDVSVTNEDDDTAGFTVQPQAGLVTTEVGGQATFTVRLTAEPSAAVTIGLSCSDTTEGRVAPASLTFNGTNWSSPQTVTVTGVNDAIAHRNLAYTIITAAATSSDPVYAAINPPNISVRNTDDDSADILVWPTSGLITQESGLEASFTVRLNTQATANVVINFGSQMEVTTDVVSLTFTPTNWNMPQTVGVLPIDDRVSDGDPVDRAPSRASPSVRAARRPTDRARYRRSRRTVGGSCFIRRRPTWYRTTSTE